MEKTDFLYDRKISQKSQINNLKKTVSWVSRFSKRTFDIVFSFLGLLIVSPFFLFCAIRLKKDSPGPVFYRGLRAGYKGRNFYIIKFRTMFEKTESYLGAPVTAKDDRRITPFGKWLRDSKVNEFPQLLNVLRGDMSFVGPRPEDVKIASKWPEDVRDEILSMRPGITSPASVTYRDEQEMLAGNNVMDQYLLNILPNKLRLDQLYIRHHSFIGDLDVIFMTLTILLPIIRKRNITETSLFEGVLARFLRKHLTWFVVDSISSFAAISAVVLLWRSQMPLDVGFLPMVIIALGMAVGLAITNTIFGLTHISWKSASPMHVLDVAASTFIAMVIFSLCGKLIPQIHLPVLLLIDFGIYSFLGSVVIRYRERLITGAASRWIRWRSQRSQIGERVLVVGAGDCGQLGIWLLEKSNLSSAFSIVGIVDDNFRMVNQQVNGLKVLGTTQEIPEIVKNKNIGLIMYAINKVDKKNRERILRQCQNLPVRIMMIPDLLTVVKDYFVQQGCKE